MVFRYVRILGNMVHAIQIKTKLCQLVEVMMERRDDLSFCQEMKFRSVHKYEKILLPVVVVTCCHVGCVGVDDSNIS